VEGLTSVIGHADRAKPLRDYCLGLMMPCERKSVEPIAAITAPKRTAAQHQSLLHFIGEGGWSDEKVLAKVRELMLPKLERHGPIEAWIIDDTSFPKKGQHSVGVARQYCGELGKQDNCQVAVTLSITNHDASFYQELKQEVGLGHFEGRGWRGFHHHATLCIAAYGFLISERETIPPSGDHATTLFPQFALRSYQPRGSAVAA
jgi:SRSO17 transposase